MSREGTEAFATDWRRLREITDSEVHAAVVANREINPTDENFWNAARMVIPTPSGKRTVAPMTIKDLEGGAAFCEWFGGTPTFHDATIREFEIRQGSGAKLVADGFFTTSEMDANGYFKLTKHFTATFLFEELVTVELYEFMEAAIIADFEIRIAPEKSTLSFSSSYGVHGSISARQISVAYAPRRPNERGM